MKNIGKTVSFEADESTGVITQENANAVYVKSEFFTGWIPKSALTEHGETLGEVLDSATEARHE